MRHNRKSLSGRLGGSRSLASFALRTLGLGTLGIGTLSVGIAFCGIVLNASAAQTPDPHSIPAVDAGIGSCSVEVTVTDAAASALYDAKVKVHIAYGFMRAHKLDLEVGSNVDGKARFTSLPDKVKEPLYFAATKGDLAGEFLYQPAGNCTAKQTIVVVKVGSNSGEHR